LPEHTDNSIGRPINNDTNKKSDKNISDFVAVTLDTGKSEDDKGSNMGKPGTNDSSAITKPLSDETVTEYTSSLWKYVPVPENEPEPHNEYDMRSIEFKNGMVLGARVRGKKHKHEGTNCDDWFELDVVDDCVLMAVSDGAGSKKYSRIGARESCKAAIQFLKDELIRIKAEPGDVINNVALPFSDPKFMDSCSKLASIVQRGILASFEAVEKAFESRKNDEKFYKPLNRELSFKDFSGTMLLSVLIPVEIENRKEYLFITCQIGDGMIAAINTDASYDKALKLLGEPDGGTFAGETDFLTSSKMNQVETLMKRTKIGRSPISCFMMMSDGVADDYYPNNPQILRLYVDMQLNGIIGNLSEHKVIVNDKNLEIIKKIPKPVKYPWVNDPKIVVPIQFAKRIIDSTGLSLEELWNNDDIISVSSLITSGAELSKKREEALKIWLDNYVERGSFDDRTLVLFYV